MADNLKSESLRMIVDGMVLSLVNDVRPQGKMNFLQNIRVFKEGILESRPTISDFLSLSPAPDEIPHSIRTIINDNTSTILRIAGAGTKLFTSATAPLIQKDTGYSGKPYFLVDFRPEQAVESYLYIADENKFKKISVSNTLSDVGIIPPSFSVTWKIGKPNRKIIDEITTGSNTDWNNLTGSAAAPTLEDRVVTTILVFLADAAAPNFASIVPVAFTSDIQAGMTLILNGADSIIVDEVLPAALNTGIATISKIVYDTGSTGKCTIVLTISSKDIVRNSILYLNSSEYVRVEDVTYDTNGLPSIRTSTTGTFAAGNTVSGVSSFRFYATNSYVATNTIAAKSIKSVISASGISSITRIFNVDLLNTGSGGRALNEDDLFHISLLLSSFGNLSEIQILLDVDSATNDFAHNWYQYVLTQNFFSSSALQTASTLSVIQQAQQRRELLGENSDVDLTPFRHPQSSQFNLGRNAFTDVTPTDSSSGILETETGSSQWTEAFIRIGDFVRFGSDGSRTLKDIKAIRISVNCTAALDLRIDSLWCGGADALDSNEQGFLPYNYVWRIRDPDTNVFSNWSPPLRQGIKLTRGRVELSFPNANSLYSTNYKIDIARFGGTLNDFRILGTIKNDGSTYTDISSDRLIADNPLAGRYEGQGAIDAVFDFYKPFTLLDTNKKGVCNVVGTTFTRTSGDLLSITYPRGTQIIIDGKANKFYSNPSTTSVTELENDMGSLTGVVFEIISPLLTGQPLPVILGPFGEGIAALFIFGLGDKKNPGTLYWLDGNSPDTMSDLNMLEITSPSEPLVGGAMYDSSIYVYSSRRSWTVIPTQDATGAISFVARENANSRGLYSPYAIGVNPTHIYFLSENADGLYRVEGNGNPECITAARFSNLFYLEGEAPTTLTLTDGTIIYPPDYTVPNELRIFCIKDFVIFRFKDTNGKHIALTFDIKLNNFISYDTFPNGQVNVFYQEEILDSATPSVIVGTFNAVKQVTGGGAFEFLARSKVIPFAFDDKDSNSTKEFKEEVFNVDPGENGFLARNYYNNGDLVTGLQTYIGSVGHKRQQIIYNLQDSLGQGVLAKNITTVYDWSILSKVKLYEEKIYFVPSPDEITNRSSDTDFAEGIGDKLWQGVVIQADTFGDDKELNYYDDRNILRATIIINHNGKQTIAYSFDQPFISHTIRRTSDDSVEWINYAEAYVTDNEPESAEVWEGEFNLSNLTGLILLKRAAIAYRSTVDATIKLIFDDGTEQEYPLPSSSNNWHKEFFYLTAKKWKACKYRIQATDGNTRIYKKHCEVWAKSINSNQPFQPLQPFGGPSNITEILI